MLCRPVVLAACILVPVLGVPATNGVVAVLGSWVAKGYNGGGATVAGSYAQGYAGLLASRLQSSGWAVTNYSVASDSTTTILDVFDASVLPADPDQMLIGLSLSDEGLADAPDPAEVSETFRSKLTNLIGRARANGIYAMTGLSYPNSGYSAAQYACVTNMNLLLNTYDLPSANFLGAVDDGDGHWTPGYNYDSKHPNVHGHEEMFYTIVPSLFDAVRLGKTTRPAPVRDDDGYAVITRDAAIHDPIRLTPDDTVHSFTTAFRVRSDCTGTVASVINRESPHALHSSDRIFVDFGPTDETKGHAAPSPDQNGHYWNNWQYGSGAVPVGASLSALVKTSGETSSAALVVTQGFDTPNGGSGYGGLMAPDPELLGDFAVTNATEDYFGTGGTAKFKITGLSGRFSYTLRFFGTRALDDAPRTTRYAAASGNGITYATNLVTTGTNVGAGGYNGNNNTIAELRNVPADGNGEVEVGVSMVSGFAYLSIMEIAVSGTVEEDDPDSLLIDFGPNDGVNGHAMASPDSNGRHWNNFVPPIHAGEALKNLVDSISAKTTTVTVAITKAFASYNGINTGGLLSPDPALLGYFAQPRATEDFFHTQTSGSGLTISGLNKSSVYTLRFFGTRADTDRRVTRFTAGAGNGMYSTNMVTTGPSVGTGGHNGNNDTIPELTGLVPDARGSITVGISNVEGTQCYLSIMEIKKERSVQGTGWGTMELRTNALVYVASTGQEIAVPIIADNKHWHDVAVAHCYAGRKTRLFVDGMEIGRLPERMAPTDFVLGGEGAATTNRMEGPLQACYQDWCVYRSAWNAGEAAAHASGAMQQASMELCAALADSRFVQGGSVDNRAKSLSKAVVNSALVQQRQKGTALLVR
jgi:hypothetical protein